MLWLLPLTVGVIGLLSLAVLAHIVRREVQPTVVAIDRFGRERRVALDQARNGLAGSTAETRRRLSRD